MELEKARQKQEELRQLYEDKLLTEVAEQTALGEKKIQHEKEMQGRREQVERDKRESQKEIAGTKLECKKEMPRHNKYQGLVK